MPVRRGQAGFASGSGGAGGTGRTGAGRGGSVWPASGRGALGGRASRVGTRRAGWGRGGRGGDRGTASSRAGGGCVPPGVPPPAGRPAPGRFPACGAGGCRPSRPRSYTRRASRGRVAGGVGGVAAGRVAPPRAVRGRGVCGGGGERGAPPRTGRRGRRTGGSFAAAAPTAGPGAGWRPSAARCVPPPRRTHPVSAGRSVRSGCGSVAGGARTYIEQNACQGSACLLSVVGGTRSVRFR
jgi:hypothetical protein